MPLPRDIWFRSSLELEELGEAIGLTDISCDAENYWAWIIGDFVDVLVDITRTHTVPPGETDTRLFLYPGHDALAPALADELVSRLHALDISPVFVGQWVPEKGDEFKKLILFTRAKP